ncbi:hypothetical protein SEA_MAIH_65 [Streptomyces phage Maih]|uniref:Uncharacterized protein n=5 Tax=Woodruffvirus TP1604 TaxID=1982746 RepID=A0A1P8VW21_9CAUD|nr:hypothetical protein AVT62_gp66 [Streptomyces phage TP1604]ALY07315.1 hypothetical protein SEA_MAIH_65 [Streptomyces phage Maih]APZ82235.1 hypothetical protein SEA_BABYGOTBAC_67 [Streptomyces phage BabyGotBac]AWN08426.1 hypothetical protein SEA_BAYC_66 [Streptomyces phage BayC]AWN08496.1 hypothetical protein SEA_SALETE_66 [Streptomyces phage Salete]USH45442.1 hypothetical protein SEA_ASIS_67 [Streptomyces phage Asis]
MSRIVFLAIMVVSALSIFNVINPPMWVSAAITGVGFSLLVNIIVDQRMKRAKGES